MPGIENKILAKDGERDGFSGFTKILEGAMKEFFLGEDGKGDSAGGFERTSQRDGIEGIA